MKNDAQEQGELFKVGQLVSRLGSDVHAVLEVSGIGDMIKVICVIPDHNGVFEVGDVEYNLSRRYERARGLLCLGSQDEK